MITKEEMKLSWKIQIKIIIQKLLSEEFKESTQFYGSILFLISNFILNVNEDMEKTQKICLDVLNRVLELKEMDNQILENIMNYIIDLITVFGKEIIQYLNQKKLLEYIQISMNSEGELLKKSGEKVHEELWEYFKKEV